MSKCSEVKHTMFRSKSKTLERVHYNTLRSFSQIWCVIHAFLLFLFQHLVLFQHSCYLECHLGENCQSVVWKFSGRFCVKLSSQARLAVNGLSSTKKFNLTSVLLISFILCRLRVFLHYWMRLKAYNLMRF